MKTFGDRLRLVLLKKKISQTQLAEKLGITQSAIAHYIKGDIKNPGLAIMKRIAEAVGVPLEWLIGYGNAPVDVQDEHVTDARVVEMCEWLAAHPERIDIFYTLYKGCRTDETGKQIR